MDLVVITIMVLSIIKELCDLVGGEKAYLARRKTMIECKEKTNNALDKDTEKAPPRSDVNDTISKSVSLVIGGCFVGMLSIAGILSCVYILSYGSSPTKIAAGILLVLSAIQAALSYRASGGDLTKQWTDKELKSMVIRMYIDRAISIPCYVVIILYMANVLTP